ncbi:MAG: VCBS repeat-containing protein [Hymenobacter sp.]|nr:MAG: VCBS repeat-containing protein [Hymenobacter sp.]
MISRLYALLSLLLLLGAAHASLAQTTGALFGFEEGSVAKLVQGADTLPHAWAGGLNAPQFSSIDLNYDGQPDLYAFDRETKRSYTFLNVAASSGGRRWQYAPVYENAFPTDLESWVLLRDYDCDGKADLFTYANGGNVRVFHNTGTASTGARFVLAKAELYFAFTPTATYNMAIGSVNLPAIQDVNGDGRLDILSYDYLGSTQLTLYLNTGTGTCTDLNNFQQATNYWGLLQACADCASYLPNGAGQCQALALPDGPAGATSTTARVQHSMGHPIALLDLNGDGVLDLIDGRDNCPQLSRLLNTGTNTAAIFTTPNITSNFPLAAPLTTSVFPAPYILDTDFDGVKDLVVCANQSDNRDDRKTMHHTVQQFRNTSGSATAVPSYAKVSDGFLQNDMLDVSEGAAPAFGDLDGDGLTDLLVGNQGDEVNGYYRASLSYYRNVGTAARPVFRLITDDYLGLAATAALTPTNRFEGLRPALVDLNRDGALDLVYSVTTGLLTATNTTTQLRFILNTARVNQVASFNPAQGDYFRPQGAGVSGSIAAAAGDTPCFFDVDNDGYVDLLVGTNEGSVTDHSLRYYHNAGANTPTNSLFVLANADFGGLRGAGGSRLASLSPLVADFNGDGFPDLLTIDGNATVRFYDDFRKQNAPFTEAFLLYFDKILQVYCK